MVFFTLIAYLLGNILILKEKVVVDQSVKSWSFDSALCERIFAVITP